MTRTGVVLIALAVAGACVMAVELAAVRLLAPWFGASQEVWTNVIGSILLALSAGYLFGSRLSSRARPLAWLGGALLASAIWTSSLPFVAESVARWFLPSGTALDEAASLLHWGSLAAAVLLFVPPTFVLGLSPPLAAESLQRDRHASAGAVGGWVLGVSTLGSLAGTFATTYWAIPTLGLRFTFLGAGALLGLLGVGLWCVDSRAKAACVPALVIASAWAMPYQGPRLAQGLELLEARESRYQSVRVVETRDGGARFRKLQVNEGLDSFQSVWQPEIGLLPPGYYYNYFAPPYWWSARPERWRVLVLGLGAGTAWRVLAGALPSECRIESDGVEIDDVVVDVGRRWMGLADSSSDLRVWSGWDGRAALATLAGTYDEIVLDAYANQTEIPAHMASVEFFREVKARLAAGGWLCINVGGFGATDPVVRAMGQTVAEAFAQRVLCLTVPYSRNCILYARNGLAVHTPADASFKTGEPPIDGLLSTFSIPGTTAVFEPGGASVLTDDRSDIERRQRQSLALGNSAELRTR